LCSKTRDTRRTTPFAYQPIILRDAAATRFHVGSGVPTNADVGSRGDAFSTG